MMNHWSMTQFAATIAAATGTEAPKHSAEPLPSVVKLVDRTLNGRADRVLIYNPDCIGHWFWQKYTDWMVPVQEYAPLAAPLSTMMPSVTPVCFGTMFTGAMPAVHGIQRYEKPVITIDSLFDSLPRAGKRVALIAVSGSSMAIIFGGRNIDYFLLPYDGDVVQKALELIEKDEYDVIVAYNQAYDDMIHKTAPEAPEALSAAKDNIAAFHALCQKAEECWKAHNTLVAFAPDHGNHTDWDGHGNHGEFREEDINVVHFFGTLPKRG
ncbi:MAG: hypothetical protein IJ074_07055 [Clostridia bacterium]|nr:hypothetical protein [Clostridia bacterium]